MALRISTENSTCSLWWRGLFRLVNYTIVVEYYGNRSLSSLSNGEPFSNMELEIFTFWGSLWSAAWVILLLIHHCDAHRMSAPSPSPWHGKANRTSLRKPPPPEGDVSISIADPFWYFELFRLALWLFRPHLRKCLIALHQKMHIDGFKPPSRAVAKARRKADTAGF